MDSLGENYKSVAVFCLVFFPGVGWKGMAGFGGGGGDKTCLPFSAGLTTLAARVENRLLVGKGGNKGDGNK